MSMKRLYAAAAAGSLLLFVASPSFGAVKLSFDDKVGSATSTTIGPNGSVNVDIILTIDAGEKVSSINYSIGASKGAALAPNMFSITSRAQDATQAGYNTPYAPLFMSKPLNTAASASYSGNLGGDVPTAADLTTGSFDTVTYTITATSAAIGTYTLSFTSTPTPPTYGGARVNGIPPATDTPITGTANLGTYTITIPEPATLAAAAFGLIGASRRRIAR